MLLQVQWYPILFRSEYMNIFLFFLLEVCDWEEILVNLWLLRQDGKYPTGWIKCLEKKSVSLIIHFSISEKLHLAENTVFLESLPLPRQKIIGRSSRPEMSVIIHRKILVTASFLIKFHAVDLQPYWKRLQHKRSPVSFAKFSGTPKMNNILGRLLLDKLSNQFLLYSGTRKFEIRMRI